MPETTRKRKPPTTWRTCPKCYGRASKIYNLSSGKYQCQQCEHQYESPSSGHRGLRRDAWEEEINAQFY